MRHWFFVVFLYITLVSSAEAGFFSDLFNQVENNHDKQFEQVEEEVIPAEEYYNKVEEPDFEEEKVFSDNSTIFEDESVENSFIKEKQIFLSFSQLPKRIYINQHFVLHVKAVLSNENVTSLKTSFKSGKAYKILNKNALWKKIDDRSYQVSYIVKVFSVDATLPHIVVTALNQKKIIGKEQLVIPTVRMVALKNSDYFSQVLADSLELISHHEKKYDEKSNIVLLEINATGANLEDFNLAFAIRQGIDSLKKRGEEQNIFYFAIVPNYQKEFKFKYFNLKSNKFNRISFPVIVSDSSVSTQTNLNPQKSKYFFYKVIGLLTLALLFLLLYMRYKKGYLLFLALILAVYTIYTKLITNNLTLPRDIMIRILPTENSTIFFKTSQPLEVKVLLKKNGYTKILLPSTKIGWIKDADFTKN